MGAALTALARAARSNPHRSIVFRTDWDDLGEEDELRRQADEWAARQGQPAGGGEVR
jgi:hypothetical protein